MREIRKSGSMSGEGKRSDTGWSKPPRPSSTLLGRFVAFVAIRPKRTKRASVVQPRRRPKAVFSPHGLSLRPRIEFRSQRASGRPL